MNKLRLRHATRRNTKAYILELGPHDLYVSYETIIGYAGPSGRFRRSNVWGPTTGRHMKEMDIRGWEEVTNEEAFAERVAKAIGYEI